MSTTVTENRMIHLEYGGQGDVHAFGRDGVVIVIRTWSTCYHALPAINGDQRQKRISLSLLSHFPTRDSMAQSSFGGVAKYSVTLFSVENGATMVQW